MENNDVILCPHCGTVVRNDWWESSLFEKKKTIQEGLIAKVVMYCTCANCEKITIKITEGAYAQGDLALYLSGVISDNIVYPVVKNELTSEFIPKEFVSEFNESINVLKISPKSSAALTRRILQNILREYYDIEERTLDAEINKFINLPNIPSHLADAVDAVRTIGNIAAHPTKNKNTGSIVDVEPGEAEWLIEVIEALFDFTFIQPKKLEERRSQLNQKLKELGKPELKSGK